MGRGKEIERKRNERKKGQQAFLFGIKLIELFGHLSYSMNRILDLLNQVERDQDSSLDLNNRGLTLSNNRRKDQMSRGNSFKGEKSTFSNFKFLFHEKFGKFS